MQLAVGARLGPYEIASPLGAGGMGEVSRARDTQLNRDVAIKACLIRCAEVHAEPRIATFDSDFGIYRWARNRRFDVL